MSSATSAQKKRKIPIPKFAPLRIPVSRRIQTACAVILVALPLVVISLNIICAIYPIFWPLFIPYVLWIYLWDRKSSSTGDKKSPFVRKMLGPIFKGFKEYFPARLVKTVDLDPNAKYIFATHPHGIIGMSLWANVFNDVSGGFTDAFPRIDIRYVTLKLNLVMPFFRELCLRLGCIDSERSTIEANLARGRSVLVMVGGAEEALYARPGSAQVILKKRKGFVRIALRMGAALVPMYCFGENELYYQLANPEGSILRSVQQFVKHITGVAFPAFSGRGIMQYSFGLLPHRTPLLTVVGAPIPVPQCTGEPSEELVMQYHELYCQKLKELYKAHRGAAEELKLL